MFINKLHLAHSHNFYKHHNLPKLSRTQHRHYHHHIKPFANTKRDVSPHLPSPLATYHPRRAKHAPTYRLLHPLYPHGLRAYSCEPFWFIAYWDRILDSEDEEGDGDEDDGVEEWYEFARRNGFGGAEVEVLVLLLVMA